MPKSKPSNVHRRAALAFASAIAGGLTIKAAHAQPQPQLEKRGPRDKGHDKLLYREIEEVMEETARIWNSQEFGKLRELWDTTDNEPWYIPEEIAEPFFTWDEIDRYWNRSGGQGLKAFRWQFSNLRVKRLSLDIALAIFDHFYEYQLPFPGAKPMAGQDRCLAIFRKTKGKWQHILYAQCPQGPEAYMRMMREEMVRPDFAKFRDDLDKKKSKR
jgi:hypothetical protein